MTKGILYFLQPHILIGTNRYKIGRTNTRNNFRLKSYGSGADIIYYNKCDNVELLERILILNFKKNFENIAGHEYFAGNVQKMKDIYLNVYNMRDKSREQLEKLINEDLHLPPGCPRLPPSIRKRAALCRNSKYSTHVTKIIKCLNSKINVIIELTKNYTNNALYAESLQELLKIMNKKYSWELTTVSTFEINDNFDKLVNWEKKYKKLYDLRNRNKSMKANYLSRVVRVAIEHNLNIRYKKGYQKQRNGIRYYLFDLPSVTYIFNNLKKEYQN